MQVTNESSPTDHVDELVRLKVLELRRESQSQTELVLEMNRVGFSNARIADLLGTTSNTVNVAIQKAKSK